MNDRYVIRKIVVRTNDSGTTLGEMAVPAGYTADGWIEEVKRLRARSISEDDFLDAQRTLLLKDLLHKRTG